MTTPLHSNATRHFEETLGVSIADLLAPVSADAPCGVNARHCHSYAHLSETRRRDDPSLPLGGWDHELKRADWREVSRLITHTLQHEGKDMQLLAWLLEAQIRQHGVAAISATLVLTREMCTQYWHGIHPNIADGDVEHRANIISSLAQKNLPAIRLAPLIGIERELPYSWADWEQAHRNEQLRAGKGRNQIEPEGASLQELQSALSSAGTDGFVQLWTQLQESLQAIEELSAALDPLFMEQAPSMANMTQLLQQMSALVESELYKRGVRPQAMAAGQEAAAVLPEAAVVTSNGVQECRPASGAIRDRADAYARLAETAEFLMRLEPHSPVPYLVRRATEWGSLNTVELYQELFLRLNGQLNIFEMLGLEVNADGQA